MSRLTVDYGVVSPCRMACRRRRSQHRSRTLAVVYTTTACIILMICSSSVMAFSPSQSRADVLSLNNSNRRYDSSSVPMPRHSTQLYNLFPKDDFDRDDFLDDDDDFDSEKYDPAVAAQIRKAKQLVKDAKRKQKAKEEAAAKAAAAAASEGEVIDDNVTTNGSDDNKANLPFFATKSFTSSAANTSQKIKSKTKSGEIIADGETMASLSKSEPWERRSLSQMFEREAREDYDGNLVDDDIDSSLLKDKDVIRSIYNLRKQLQNEDFKKVFDDRNRFIGEVD